MKRRYLLILTTLFLFSCAKGEQITNSSASSSSVISNAATSNSVNSSFNNASHVTSNTNLSISGFNGNVLPLNIISSCGDLETGYVTWNKIEGIDNYVVKYKSKTETNYYQVDDMLIRNYDDYVRVDIPGLTKGTYDIEITSEVKDNKVYVGTSEFEVKSNVREGFAFTNGKDVGAYNEDGTLKKNAVIVYVTKNNAKTVKTTIDGVEYKGIQTILHSKEAVNSSTPLDIRVIGSIGINDLDYYASKAEGLQLKGKVKNQVMNTTIEGIGEDASFNGFGLLMRNCSNVEVKNLGIMNQLDDGISIDTDNSYIWVHNNDLFYGKNKGGDQAKGDGSIDTKKSTMVTISFNHFFDSGKCNLQGMHEELPTHSITYHHNWYDHSDSRHPRVRIAQVHVYNNYYDGNAKYGVGAAEGSSVFVENNYFRNCKYPMMSSMQGSDTTEVFSGENGGMIKSFGNYMTGQTGYITYEQNNSSFDAYEAKERNEVVPNTIKAKLGESTYNNFDTSESMYKYNVETPEEAKNTVIKYSGRVGGGDIKYTFSASEDNNYEIIPELEKIVRNYKDKMISVQGEVSSITPKEDENNSSVIQNSESSSSLNTNLGTVTHIFQDQELTSSVFTISGNLSSSKGSVTYNGLTLTKCLKMETSTSIKFTVPANYQITLICNEGFNGKFVLNGTKYPANNGVITLKLSEGLNEITKGDSTNIFVMILEEIK